MTHSDRSTWNISAQAEETSSNILYNLLLHECLIHQNQEHVVVEFLVPVLESALVQDLVLELSSQ